MNSDVLQYFPSEVSQFVCCSVVILEQQLTQSAEAFINHPRGVEVEDGELFLSSIFSWYADDFGDDEKEIIDQIRQFANPDLKASLVAIEEISDYDYNWQINGR